jgi:hypothetical protein
VPNGLSATQDRAENIYVEDAPNAVNIKVSDPRRWSHNRRVGDKAADRSQTTGSLKEG